MHQLLNRIIFYVDHESFYESLDYKLLKPVHFAFVGGKQVDMLPKVDTLKGGTRLSIKSPLFTDEKLTSISLNLGRKGILYLKQRPKFTLSKIISENEGVDVDVITSGSSLLWSFYNNSNSDHLLLFLEQGPDTENLAKLISANCADIKIRREIVSRVLIKINAKGVNVPVMQPESNLVTMLGPITLKEIQLLVKGKKKRTIQKLLKKHGIQNIDKKGREHLYDPTDIVNLVAEEGGALNITEVMRLKFNELEMSKSQDLDQPLSPKLADIGTVSYQRVKDHIRNILYSHKDSLLYEEAVDTGTVKYLEVEKSHPDEKENYYLTAAANAARDFLRAEEKLKQSPFDRDLDSE